MIHGKASKIRKHKSTPRLSKKPVPSEITHIVKNCSGGFEVYRRNNCLIYVPPGMNYEQWVEFRKSLKLPY